MQARAGRSHYGEAVRQTLGSYGRRHLRRRKDVQVPRQSGVCRRCLAFLRTNGAKAGADPRPYIAEVRAALDDDLNAPRAVNAVTDLANSISHGGSNQTAVKGLLKCCTILGIDL